MSLYSLSIPPYKPPSMALSKPTPSHLSFDAEEHSIRPRSVLTGNLWKSDVVSGNSRSNMVQDFAGSVPASPESAAGPRKASIASIVSPNHDMVSPGPSSKCSPTAPSSPSSVPSKRNGDHLDEDSDGSATSLTSTAAPNPASCPCLCASEPKIPRPRNSFMLYRQHHYAAVVAKYPGINNPEVSKILGEAWRNETEPEKAKWKAFAEEDKMKHQQRHPSYRYQPKRHKKVGCAIDGSSKNWSESQACPRCSRAQSQQQDLPAGNIEKVESEDASPRQTRSNTVILLPPKHLSNVTPITAVPQVQHLSLGSPGNRSHGQLAATPNSNVWSAEEQFRATLSPHKRRMDSQPFAPTPLPTATTFAYSHSMTGPPGTPTSALAQDQARRISLPPAADLLNKASNTVVPPFTSGPGYSQHRIALRRAPVGRDLSLKLPPLQSATGEWRSALVSGGLSTSSTPRASHMGQPLTAKPNPLNVLWDKFCTLKKVLKNISDKQSGSSIIAIEGDDLIVTQELSNWLAETLKDADTHVRVINGPQIAEKNGVSLDHLFECMDCVKEWHIKGKEITDYVSRTVTQDPPTSTPKKQRSIVIINSYVLTATNKFAAWIPQTNDHNGKMHWEWTACMWRGVLAPDLLIYAKNIRPEETPDRAAVDVLDGGRLMIVKKSKGEAESASGVEGVQGAALRRLGFEVGEWIRAREE